MSSDAPLTSGIVTTDLDAEVRPQDDLFRHVNGKWLKDGQIPPDRPFDGAFFSLRDRAEAEQSERSHLRSWGRTPASRRDAGE